MTDSRGGVYYTSYYEATADNGHKYRNWFIAYKLPNNNDKTLKKKLESRAKSTGLLIKNTASTAYAIPYNADNKNSQFVALEVMHFGGNNTIRDEK